MAQRFLQIGVAVYNKDHDIIPVTVEMDKLIPSNHELFLRFLDYDLHIVDRLLKEYLSCLDQDKPPRKQYLQDAITALRQMHPYFLLCSENAALLLNRIFAGYISARFNELDEFEQKNLFLKVCLSDYDLYTDPDEIFDAKISSGHPYVLDYLFDLQRNIQKWVFLTIDNTNPALARLSTNRRLALYSHATFKDEFHPLAAFDTEFSIRESSRMLKRSISWEFRVISDKESTSQKEKPSLLEIHYEKLRQEVNQLFWNPTADIPKTMQEVIDATKDVNDCNIITYNIRDFSNLLEMEVFWMIQEGCHIKRCKNCHQYFILDKSNLEYCHRIAPGSSKPCSEIGRYLVYDRKKASSNPAYALYRRAAKTQNQRASRGQITKEEYDAWNQKAVKNRDLVGEGKLDIADYERWLKQ